MNNLFSENFEVLTKFIFNLYDFDNDGRISREDINVIFSYISIKTRNKNIFKYANEDYKDRIESKEEIFKIVENIFNNKQTIDFEEFSDITENRFSETFIYVNLKFKFFIFKLAVNIHFGKETL